MFFTWSKVAEKKYENHDSKYILQQQWQSFFRSVSHATHCVL
jgi:hypothetical protein